MTRNAEHDSLPGSHTTSCRFQAVVARFPGLPAVADQDGCLTYQQLAEQAIRVSRVIRPWTAESGTVVICTAMGAKLVGLLLGVLHIGRAYLCADPADPPARLRAILAQSQASLLIADEAVRHCLPGTRSISTENALDSQDCQPTSADGLPRPARPEEPCCLVQTSGSAGQPQGVSISHRSLLHNIDNYRTMLGIGPADRVSLLASPRFGAANSSIYGSLLSGACLCPFDIKARGFAALIQWLQEERITVLHTTPSLFRALARQVEPQTLPHLRAIKLGGEAAYPADVALFRATFSSGCLLVNGLGLSEAGGNLCHYVVPPDGRLPNEDTVPVGRPLKGHEVTVVGEDGQEVPAGHEGDIVVRSAYLADPGWQRPANGTSPHEVLLRTRDRGKALPDGCLVHLGRQDSVVKLRGYRVDLNAIEAALLQLPGVRNAVVLCRDSLDHRTHLVAFVESTVADDAEPIRRQLAQLLPDYMIPQRLVLLPRLPLTASGKIDRQRLLREGRDAARPMPVPARTALEKRLAHIWSETLQRDDIGVYDNFFERGGDSLQGLELILKLSREQKANLPLALLLNHPTVAQMAEAMSAGFVRSSAARWFGNPQVALLALRKSGRQSPLVFIPGGYTSESELLVLAGLLPHLKPDRPVYGVRLDLLAHRVLPPWSIAGLARKVIRAMMEEFGAAAPILVGECQACALAYETAQRLARLARTPPRLILLEPWQPHAASQPYATGRLPLAIRRYYRLLRTYQPRPYGGELHLIRCQESPHVNPGADSWEQYARATFRHVVPGDHHTYLRQERHSLTQTLNAICQRAAVIPKAG